MGISSTTVDASITIKKNGVTLANLIESVAVTTAMPGSPKLLTASRLEQSLTRWWQICNLWALHASL